jgi:hypothetical protein
MLTKLPFEVFCIITQYLETEELLICSGICKEWREFIAKRQLIRVLEPTFTQFDSVVEAIEKHYINGSQITQLITECYSGSCPTSFSNLPRYFPNLKKLEYKNRTCISIISKHKVEAFKAWQHSLESLCVFGRASEMVMLLEKCRFERLVHLDIGRNNDAYDFDDDDLTEGFDENLVSTLEYLPQLKSLSIHGLELTYALLEKLHKYLPLLEKLKLDYSIVLFPEGLPLEIPLADKLTHFACKTQRVHKNEQFVLQYIISKYPSLVSFDYSRNFATSTFQLALIDHLNTSLEPIFLSLISQLPSTLKTFKLQSFRTTKAVIDAVARLPHLDAFYLCNDARRDRQVATLQYCHSKNVLQSLQELWISAWRFQETGIDAEFETSLKKLNVDCKYQKAPGAIESFHLNGVFKVHPLLEELSILASGYTVDINNDFVVGPLNVKKLRLCVDILADQVIPFIRDKMPHLKQLSLEVHNDELGPDESAEYEMFSLKEISLPDHSLEYLHITVSFNISVAICSVSSIIDNKRKYYLYSRSECKVKYCGTELPNIKVEKDEVYEIIDIYCKELWHLQIGEIKIF